MPILLAFINDKKQVLDGEGSYTSSHRSMREVDEALRKVGFSQTSMGMTVEKAVKKILLAFIGANGNLWDSAPGPYISPHQSMEETDMALRKADCTFTREFPISANDRPKNFASD